MAAVAEIEYKYKEELAALGGCCPPADASPVDMVAFRYVKDPVSAQCFLPVALKDPRRVLDEKAHGAKCSMYGLSMYSSEASARTRFLALERQIKQIRKKIGSHLARGTLVPSDGVATHPNHAGHFDFFEIASSTVENRFEVMGRL